MRKTYYVLGKGYNNGSTFTATWFSNTDFNVSPTIIEEWKEHLKERANDIGFNGAFYIEFFKEVSSD